MNEKNINFSNIKYLLQNIANEIINGEENIKYGNGVHLAYLDQNTTMYFDSKNKIFVINNLFFNILKVSELDKILFLMLFIHECMHAVENENYHKENDPIRKFFEFIKINSSCTFNNFDDINHDYYYSEIEAHVNTLKIIDSFDLSKKLVDLAKG